MTSPANLKRLREAKGLTQEEAATRAGMLQYDWSRWESGERGADAADKLRRIAKALGVPLAKLTQ